MGYIPPAFTDMIHNVILYTIGEPVGSYIDNGINAARKCVNFEEGLPLYLKVSYAATTGFAGLGAIAWWKGSKMTAIGCFCLSAASLLLVPLPDDVAACMQQTMYGNTNDPYTKL